MNGELTSSGGKKTKHKIQYAKKELQFDIIKLYNPTAF